MTTTVLTMERLMTRKKMKRTKKMSITVKLKRRAVAMRVRKS